MSNNRISLENFSNVMGFYVKPSYIQVYLRDIGGLVLDHHCKANCNLFAGRDSCLQFVKRANICEAQ